MKKHNREWAKREAQDRETTRIKTKEEAKQCRNKREQVKQKKKNQREEEERWARKEQSLSLFLVLEKRKNGVQVSHLSGQNSGRPFYYVKQDSIDWEYVYMYC